MEPESAKGEEQGNGSSRRTNAFTAALRESLGPPAGRPWDWSRWGPWPAGTTSRTLSDHNYFVVVEPASAEPNMQMVSWLPRADAVLLSFRETAHSLKVIYDDGHLLELAVFTPQELALARVDRHRVLLDRADVTTRMKCVAQDTASAAAAAATDEALLGPLLAALLVGVGRRLRRGGVSGRNLVHAQALRHLLVFFERHVPRERRGLLDDLDPHRRFEAVYPDLGRQVESALLARRRPWLLLDLAEQELQGAGGQVPVRHLRCGPVPV